MELIGTPNDGDVTSMTAPTRVAIPETLDDACGVLNDASNVMSAGHWGTAAIVWAHTQPESHGGDRRSSSFKDEKSSLKNIAEFASLKIRGLTTRDSVRKYRRAWEEAIERGWAEPARPGSRVKLPSQPFKTEGKAHVSHNSGENEWYTPEHFVEAARAVMGGIDLDPASTSSANKVVKATRFYSESDDGLTKRWKGRVWMNPPYELSLVRRFTQKLVDSYLSGAVEQACLLVNNATDTTWWQHVSEHASALCLPKGRVRFWHSDRDSCAPLQGQSILYLGDRSQKFCETFASFGAAWSRFDNAIATRERIHNQLWKPHGGILPTNGSSGSQIYSCQQDGR